MTTNVCTPFYVYKNINMWIDIARCDRFGWNLKCQWLIWMKWNYAHFSSARLTHIFICVNVGFACSVTHKLMFIIKIWENVIIKYEIINFMSEKCSYLCIMIVVENVRLFWKQPTWKFKISLSQFSYILKHAQMCFYILDSSFRKCQTVVHVFFCLQPNNVAENFNWYN